MDSINQIKKIAGELAILYEMGYEQTAPTVYHIMNTGIKDPKTIEWHLDQLLNYPIEKSLNLFLELCAHYEKIDPESAEFYYEEYDELYGEEDKKTRKRTTN